jgi:Domain of unknown function (DUF4174)
MKKLIYTAFVCLFCSGSEISAQNFDLKNYVWRKRVLLVFAPDAEHESYKQQLRAVKRDKKDFEDRDLIVVSLFAASGLDENNNTINAEKVRILRRKYNILNTEFRAILIGKDGGKKESREKPFDNPQLFKIIDAMPMRKDEMKSGLD